MPDPAPSGDPPDNGPPSGQPDAGADNPQSPRPLATTLPPGAFVQVNGPQPRPNLGSMLFLTMFFFFMSGNNQMPPSPIIVGPDGEIQPRVTELGLAGQLVDEYRGFLNETGNWTEPADPRLLASEIVPLQYSYPVGPHFQNITGFYREARLHPANLLSSNASSFFDGVTIPNLNDTAWNETEAKELRGEYPWENLIKWDMNLKERTPENATDEWNWVKGSATLTAADESTIEYGFFGLHYRPNGTYELYGLPEGMRVDIRDITRLWPESERNATRQIVLGELEKELKVQQDNLLLSEVQPDEQTLTRCPVLAHLALPPIPAGSTQEEIDLYEAEMREPTGIRLSLPHPPGYWERGGLGGVLIADQCGWAFGLEGGKGIRIDDFWQRSVNYAAFATASQFLVLILLVRQMESTRTPSSLTKVSMWTIVIMGITDSWIFSAHVVVGIMSDNRTSLPMLVPGFMCLCTAVVFGPRYAVLLHRIQAPERAAPAQVQTAPAPAVAPAPGTAPLTGGALLPPPVTAPTPSPMPQVRGPIFKWIGGIAALFFILQIAFLAPVFPFFLVAMYSFWLPQIWRNATRGNTRALDRGFVVGTAAGRLALPLYVFGYTENVFFVERSTWVWGLVAWQGLQILFMFAQERFGPAFFLPKSFQPEDSYNYHPILSAPDPENPADESEKTCSICMEEVDTKPGPSGEALLGIGARRGYALAPCGHLFHTKCLAQWLSIKTICPLCKRSLPPL